MPNGREGNSSQWTPDLLGAGKPLPPPSAPSRGPAAGPGGALGSYLNVPRHRAATGESGHDLFSTTAFMMC